MVELSNEDIFGPLDQFIENLLAAAGCAQPPVDAIDLARRHLGMVVCLDRSQTHRGRAQRNRAGRLIYLRPESLPERHQWTVAHEIGEHLRPQLLAALGLESGTPTFAESLANVFAYRLLVPTCWFVEDARLLEYQLPELKRRYSTASHEVIAWRMLDLPEPCVITIVDNEHVTKRKSNAWPVTRRLVAAERSCLDYVHNYSRARRVQADGWTVYGWPVHRPDWKREILRSVFEE